jgi:putative transcriptional regulator
MSPTLGYAQHPRHHPSDELLLRHAAGRLAPVPALVVSTHLPFCAQCRAAVRLGETIGGVLLADMPGEELAPDSLSRTLSHLDVPARSGATEPGPIELAPGVPLPDTLRGLVRPGWRWLAPGISRITLDVPRTSPEERIYLLRIAAGTRLPKHGHRGWEATCVLAGHFHDASGEYGPGDVAEADGAVMHEPIAGDETGCICLIVCQGRLRLHGLVARLIQPFIGV